MARLLPTTGRRRGGGTARLLARGLAAGRIGLGVALVAAPDVTARRWLGRAAEDPGTHVAVRGLGARDVALGLGALVALRDGNDVRHAARWLEAAVVADLADAASTAVATDVDDASHAPIVIGALAAAALGLGLRARLR